MSQIKRLYEAALECHEYLDEAIETQNIDLLEKLSAAMNDVLVVHRRTRRPEAGKQIEHFTNEDLRDSDIWEGDLL